MDIRTTVKAFFVLVILLVSPLVYGSKIDSLLEEANVKASQGDFKGAAVSYREALKLDNTNKKARIGLANALINAQVEEPYAEESEAVSETLSMDPLDKFMEQSS